MLDYEKQKLLRLIMLNLEKTDECSTSLESPNTSGIKEWAILELQGDLQVRSDQIMNGQFVGDLCYNKYGQPGREQKMDKPYAVLEKSKTNDGVSLDDTMSQLDSTSLDLTIDRTLLDSTIALENKSRQKTEYTVRAIVTKKLVFKSRPKPIIANIAMQV